MTHPYAYYKHTPPTLQKAVEHFGEYVNVTDVTDWRKKNKWIF